MSGGGHHTTREGRAPTREEFLAAKGRELARHNLRLSYMTGRDVLTPEDRELLSGDTPADEVRDQETVKRWSAARGPNRR
ncbi:MAG: hypothetical protein M3R38_15745 [Actinomycetota bacterium]|nr:hypothetical protein [Actinomycetota bacterium]